MAQESRYNAEHGRVNKAGVIRATKDHIEKVLNEADYFETTFPDSDSDFLLEGQSPPYDQDAAGPGGDEGLYNTEINEYMKRYPDYLGTIAHNEIQSKIIPLIKKQSRGGFIINTDPADQPGQHWQCIYFDARPGKDGSIEFYDSFADKPSKTIMQDIIDINNKLEPQEYLKLKVNTIKEQSATSSNCGFFCMKFLMDRFRGRPFKDTTKIISNVQQGEAAIEKFNEQ